MYSAKKVVFGQNGSFRAKLIITLYSDYLGKVVVFGQKWFYSVKVVVFGQKMLYLVKMVVFGKSGIIRSKWLNSDKVVVIWQK